MRRMAVATFLVLAGGALVGIALAVPKPADVPISWELQFTYKTPQPVRVTLPGQRQPTTFWYLEYTVTNQTKEEQRFVPDFVLYTGTGQVLRSGQGVPSSVFEKIKADLNAPLLKDQVSVSGKLLRGLNNAKQGVMIFQDIDPEAGAFDIFVGGLSGESVAVTLPNPVPKVVRVSNRDANRTTVMKDAVVLSKTLQLHYGLPGQASSRFRSGAVFKSRTWVMR